jgi:hypothetical protein
LKKQLIFIFSIFIIIALVVGCSTQTNVESNSEPRESKNDNGNGDVAETPYFEGKEIEFIVPTNPGGGSDSMARFYAPYLTKHIEGNPKIYIENIPGGGTIIGANEFYQARESTGLHLLLGSVSANAAYVLGASSVEYDLSKMESIISYPDGQVAYTSPKMGINKPSDIFNPKEKLVYPASNPLGVDLIPLLAFEILGIDVQVITGYDGGGATRLAFESGEANIDTQTTTAYTNSVQELVSLGEAIPLFSMGQLDANGDVVRDPTFADIPSIKEFYIDAHGKEPSGEAWEVFKQLLGPFYSVQKNVFVHGDIPAEALKALRDGAVKMFQDPDFIEESKTALGNYDPILGDDLSLVVKSMNVSDETRKWVVNFLNEKHGVQVN